MIIEFRNEFHNTRAKIRVKGLPCRLSRRQVQHLVNRLCGNKGCRCLNYPNNLKSEDARFEVDWDSRGEWYAYVAPPLKEEY